MNFTFSFFVPIMTAFTTLWAVAALTGISPTQTNHMSGQPVRLKSCLRTTKKYRHKWVVPNKPIKRLRQRRGALRREGAIADLRFPPASATANKRLKRGDSEPFILVDFGNHFKMVEPNLARRNYRAVPTNIRTLAPLHALGAHIEEDELRGRLLVAPIRATKRVRFEDDEEEEEEEEPPSRKRLRLV